MQFKGILFALCAAFFFGLTPTTTKLAYNLGANPTFAIFLRYTFAIALIILPILLIKINFKIIAKHLLGLLLISLGSLCLTIGLLMSVIFIPVSLVALIFYTYPLLVLIYTFFAKKNIKQIHIIGFLSAFIGLGFALGPTFHSLNIFGLLLALLASIGAATVLICNEHLAKHLNAITINAFTNFLCFFIFSIIILVKYEINLPATNTGWYFIVFASLCYCIAFYAQLLAVPKIGSTLSSLLLYLEPVVVIITAILFLNETLSSLQILGTIIVIISLIFTTLQTSKKI